MQINHFLHYNQSWSTAQINMKKIKTCQGISFYFKEFI